MEFVSFEIIQYLSGGDEETIVNIRDNNMRKFGHVEVGSCPIYGHYLTYFTYYVTETLMTCTSGCNYSLMYS
jgi:hypothetical protein